MSLLKAKKVALIGNGKTGKFVAELLGVNCTIYNRSNRPTAALLAQADVIICFVPTDALPSLIPLMLEANRPVVVGTTGFDNWEGVDLLLKNQGQKWIVGSNFAMGMALVYHLIKTMAKSTALFQDFSFSLHEVHHTKKLDAPSGTAKSWAEWLNVADVAITSERIGDVVGTHQLTLSTPSEKIILEHQSLDRKVFARGALWAAEQLLENGAISNGIVKFEELTREVIHESTRKV